MLLSERSIQLMQIVLQRVLYCTGTRIAQTSVLSTDPSTVREVLVGVLLFSLPFLFNHTLFWVAYHLKDFYKRIGQMPPSIPYPAQLAGKIDPFIREIGFIIKIDCMHGSLDFIFVDMVTDPPCRSLAGGDTSLLSTDDICSLKERAGDGKPQASTINSATYPCVWVENESQEAFRISVGQVIMALSFSDIDQRAFTIYEWMSPSPSQKRSRDTLFIHWW